MEYDFALILVVGFAIGFILAGLVGFVSSRILWYWGRVTAIWRPQTIVLTTDRTPWQVLVDGCRSLLTLIIITALISLGIFLCVAVTVDWEEVIAFVRSMAQP
jgi:hypothetical protein